MTETDKAPGCSLDRNTHAGTDQDFNQEKCTERTYSTSCTATAAVSVAVAVAVVVAVVVAVAEGGAGETLCIISCLPLSTTEADDDDDFVPKNCGNLLDWTGGYATEISKQFLFIIYHQRAKSKRGSALCSVLSL